MNEKWPEKRRVTPPRSPRNGAAERLAAKAKREAWGNWEAVARFDIPAIKAEERSRVIAEIRERLQTPLFGEPEHLRRDGVFAILDEVERAR